MLLLAIAWLYVVVLMAVAEATSAQGSALGALVTFLLYGVLPLGIALYLLGAPSRRSARRRAALAESAGVAVAGDPHRSAHPPGHLVAPEREEP